MKNFTVRRPKNEGLKPQCCKGTVKHGGGSKMAWRYFSFYGLGSIHKIKEVVDPFVYKDVLDITLFPYTE